MYKARIISGDSMAEHFFSDEISVLTIIDSGFIFHKPCGGKQTCGKCLIKVEGPQNEMSERERSFLSDDDVKNGLRLACFAKVSGDCTVTLPKARDGARILSDTGDIKAGSGTGYGVSVDIGTTTVAMSLYDMASGRLIGSAAALNDEGTFGADVIARINYFNEHGMEPLRTAITSQLYRMLNQCLGGKNAADITFAVVTGNTTMLHLLTGLDCKGIAVAPFTTTSLFGENVGSKEVFAGIEIDFPVYLPRCVGAYVGADITCGVLATGLDKSSGTALLCDIGTNGEMVICSDGKMTCCSTAAGPAFEGAEIHNGVISCPGAINTVAADGETVTYTTIDNAGPVGICGSGLLDAAAVMFRLGLIEESGAIDEERADSLSLLTEHNDQPALKIGDSGIILTAGDVRKLQLAKAAIRAGIETLIHVSGKTYNDIDRLVIAGGFGSYLNKQSAADIGLIPPELTAKVEIAGNTSAKGAAILLMDETLRDELYSTAVNMEELPLSGSATFMDFYIEQMFFGL